MGSESVREGAVPVSWGARIVGLRTCSIEGCSAGPLLRWRECTRALAEPRVLGPECYLEPNPLYVWSS